MVSDDAQVFAAAIGIVLGLLYAASGFTDPGKTDDLAKNPRVRNLLWLLGGALTVLLTDWKLFSSAAITPEQRATFVATYAIFALSAAVGGVAVIAALIALSLNARARRNIAFRDRIAELVLEYVQYGYRSYRTRFDRLEAVREPAHPAQAASQIGQILATLMVTTALERSRDDAQLRDDTIDKVLEGIESMVRLFAPGADGLHLRTNYMARVSEAGLQGARPLFVDGPLSDYAGFLVLRRYKDGRQADVCLPFEPTPRERRVLPGAPASVTSKAACRINVAAPEFRPGVPPALRADVKHFFKDVPYVSVLSAPLIWERDVVGVVNVESSHVDLVDQGADMVERIAEALGPFCMILGELVHRGEE